MKNPVNHTVTWFLVEFNTRKVESEVHGIVLDLFKYCRENLN